MILVIIGDSGSGKSTLANFLADNYGYEKVVTYTTRPKRDKEIDGVDYVFVDDDKFCQLHNIGYFLETAVYNMWCYGTPKNTIYGGKNVNKIVVLSPSGFRKLMKDKQRTETVISIYLKVPRRDRMINSLKRGDNIEEIYRRSLSDIGMFDGVENEVDLVIRNDGYTKTPTEIYQEIRNKIGI